MKDKKIQKSKVIFRVLWLGIAIWSIYLALAFMLGRQNKKLSEIDYDSIKTCRGVIVEVEEENERLFIMPIDEQRLISNIIPFAEEGDIGFKVGQEVLVYYTGFSPRKTESLGNTVKKIKIVKQKSNKKITLDVLRECYYSNDKVSVSVSELTKTGITYRIIDDNEFAYNYGDGITYKLLKKIRKSENQEYYNEEKISDVPWRDTIVYSKDIGNNVFERCYDWTKLYGELDERRV